MTDKVMKVWIPFYHNPPQKFIEYVEERFIDRAGNTGLLRTAHFINKRGKPDTMVAQVEWDNY